jgi:hypothetical protein
MEATREQTRAAIGAAEKIYADAVASYKRAAWQRDVGQVLATAQFGLQAYQAIAMVTAKFSPPASAAALKPEEPRSGVSTPEASAKGVRIELSRQGASRSYTDAATALLAQIRKSPASQWTAGLPANRLVRSEAQLRQMLAYLDLADQAAVFNKLAPASRSSDSELLRNGIKGLNKGNWSAVLTAAVTPSSTVPADQDLLGGLSHRNDLRRQALHELALFTQIRTKSNKPAPGAP